MTGTVYAVNKEEAVALRAVNSTVDVSIGVLLDRVQQLDLTATMAAFDLYNIATDPTYVVDPGFGTIEMLTGLGFTWPVHSMQKEIVAAGLTMSDDGMEVTWHKPKVKVIDGEA